MQTLSVLSVEDGAIIVASPAGERFRLPLDATLRARLQHPASSPDDKRLSPREIQAHVRAGRTAEQVAAMTGVPVAFIERYVGPVLAERAYVVESAQAVRLPAETEGARSRTFGEVMGERLAALAAKAVDWSSAKGPSGWIITVAFIADDVQHAARWRFDAKHMLLEPDNVEASTLSQQGVPAALTPRLRAIEPTAPVTVIPPTANPTPVASEPPASPGPAAPTTAAPPSSGLPAAAATTRFSGLTAAAAPRQSTPAIPDPAPAGPGAAARTAPPHTPGHAAPQRSAGQTVTPSAARTAKPVVIPTPPVSRPVASEPVPTQPITTQPAAAVVRPVAVQPAAVRPAAPPVATTLAAPAPVMPVRPAAPAATPLHGVRVAPTAPSSGRFDSAAFDFPSLRQAPRTPAAPPTSTPPTTPPPAPAAATPTDPFGRRRAATPTPALPDAGGEKAAPAKVATDTDPAAAPAARRQPPAGMLDRHAPTPASVAPASPDRTVPRRTGPTPDQLADLARRRGVREPAPGTDHLPVTQEIEVVPRRDHGDVFAPRPSADQLSAAEVQHAPVRQLPVRSGRSGGQDESITDQLRRRRELGASQGGPRPTDAARQDRTAHSVGDEPDASTAAGGRPRRGRTSMPSWDEIVFGRDET